MTPRTGTARRIRIAFVALTGLWLLVASAANAATPPSPRIVTLTATGTVDQVLAGYIAEGVAAAERAAAAAVVIELNTPGGSLDATSRIVSTLLESRVPVIVWVAPAGARAASAGTFITLAAHVALMAPGTNIGAASPVGGDGQDIPGTLGEKVLNDAIASIRSIAETRGRNVDWAIATVRDAKSSPASEAVEVGAVDGIAASFEDVIAMATGRTISLNGAEVTLELTGAARDGLPMNPLQGFLHLLSDPNIAFILFTVGFYGLLYELMNPNFVTGILGGIALILAFIGSGSLPLNVAGVLLLGLAVLLLFLETSVNSHGLLAVGGVVCFVLGAATFYTEPGPGLPSVEVSWPVVAFTGGLGVGFSLLVLRAAIQSRRINPLAIAGLGGSGQGTTGLVAEVRRDLAPAGSVYVAGEEWSARSAAGEVVPRGRFVRVIGQDGLVLIVEPLVDRPAPLDDEARTVVI